MTKTATPEDNLMRCWNLIQDTAVQEYDPVSKNSGLLFKNHRTGDFAFICAEDIAAIKAAFAVKAEPINGIPATLRHGEGAVARCSYCGRYSLDHRTLGDSHRQPALDCGEKHGWCGSFKKPERDATWSGEAPKPSALAASPPPAVEPGAVRFLSTEDGEFNGNEKPEPVTTDDWLTGDKLTPEQAWTILCETPDITSPEEYPNHALITLEQLSGFMERAASTDLREENERLKEEIASKAEMLSDLREDYPWVQRENNKLRSRAVDAEARAATLSAENTALRQIISDCASAIGNGAFASPDCSVEFMQGIPNEMRLHSSALKERLKRVRNKVPARALSDKDLADEILAVDQACTGGFGEGSGSPGEWWYERADELHHESVRRAALAREGK